LTGRDRPSLCKNAKVAYIEERDFFGAGSMKRFVEGEERTQVSLLPACLGDYVEAENPVRVVEVFVDGLDLGALGFVGVDPATTGRPAYHPAVLLKIYIYGYLNRVQSSRRLEREAQRNVELMWLTGRRKDEWVNRVQRGRQVYGQKTRQHQPWSANFRCNFTLGIHSLAGRHRRDAAWRQIPYVDYWSALFVGSPEALVCTVRDVRRTASVTIVGKLVVNRTLHAGTHSCAFGDCAG
jgi:Transposase domain (DUF772)